MPQTLLPIFPSDSTPINDILYVQKRNGQVYYFHGCHPVFSHAEDDMKSFRMFTSQLVVNGNCKQVDIVRAFKISPISMKRYVKKYREGGVKAFFTTRRKRKPRVLTNEVIQRAEELLNEGKKHTEVAVELGIKRDTLYRAILSGRVRVVKKKRNQPNQK